MAIIEVIWALELIVIAAGDIGSNDAKYTWNNDEEDGETQ